VRVKAKDRDRKADAWTVNLSIECSQSLTMSVDETHFSQCSALFFISRCDDVLV
jgi:hypothetical protein